MPFQIVHSSNCLIDNYRRLTITLSLIAIFFDGLLQRTVCSIFKGWNTPVKHIHLALTSWTSELQADLGGGGTEELIEEWNSRRRGPLPASPHRAAHLTRCSASSASAYRCNLIHSLPKEPLIKVLFTATGGEGGVWHLSRRLPSLTRRGFWAKAEISADYYSNSQSETHSLCGCGSEHHLYDAPLAPVAHR